MKKYFVVLVALSLFPVVSVGYAMRGGNGGGNGPGSLLPPELEPILSDSVFCKEGEKIYIEWDLANSYGEILTNTGISWGKLSNGTWTKKANGTQDYIEFNLTDGELLGVATGTQLSFSGNAHWHGWTISISGNAIAQDIPHCQNL